MELSFVSNSVLQILALALYFAYCLLLFLPGVTDVIITRKYFHSMIRIYPTFHIIYLVNSSNPKCKDQILILAKPV